MQCGEAAKASTATARTPCDISKTPSSSGAMTDSGDGDLWNELSPPFVAFCWTSRLHCHRSACRRALPAAPATMQPTRAPAAGISPVRQQVREDSYGASLAPSGAVELFRKLTGDIASSSDAIGNKRRLWHANEELQIGRLVQACGVGSESLRSAPTIRLRLAAWRLHQVAKRQSTVVALLLLLLGADAASNSRLPRVASLDSARRSSPGLESPSTPGPGFYRTSMSNMGRQAERYSKSFHQTPAFAKPTTPNARAKSPFGTNGAAAPPTPQSYSAPYGTGRDTISGRTASTGAAAARSRRRRSRTRSPLAPRNSPHRPGQVSH